MTNLMLFDRLRADNLDVWKTYTHHAFVQGLQNGDLPKQAFQHYLKQDYVFLIHFARAYALTVYKSDNLTDMRSATEVLNAILNVEMGLHVGYCAEWGITREELEKTEEEPQNMAYTRYVLERGMAGDVMDLLVALCPCAIGYGEIGVRLAEADETKRDGNPYLPWIEMYSSQEHRDTVEGIKQHLDNLARTRYTEERFPELSKTFLAATKLEVEFWQMGLNVLPENR